jgi:hypothetical protein
VNVVVRNLMLNLMIIVDGAHIRWPRIKINY